MWLLSCDAERLGKLQLYLFAVNSRYVSILLLFKDLNADWRDSSLTAMLVFPSCSVTVAIATGVSLSALGLITMVMSCGGWWDLSSAVQQQDWGVEFSVNPSSRKQHVVLEPQLLRASACSASDLRNLKTKLRHHSSMSCSCSDLCWSPHDITAG